MRITKGLQSLDVLYSGSITTPRGSNSVTLTVADLAFVLKFSDAKGAIPDVQAGAPSGKSMTLTLTGFDNPLGTSFDADVGTANGRKLSLALVIHAITGAAESIHPPRLVHFTFMLGGQA